MNVPVRRDPRRVSAGWETIRYALDSNARTFRLCLILLVVSVPSVVGVIELAARLPW